MTSAQSAHGSGELLKEAFEVPQPFAHPDAARLQSGQMPHARVMINFVDGITGALNQMPHARVMILHLFSLIRGNPRIWLKGGQRRMFRATCTEPGKPPATTPASVLSGCERMSCMQLKTSPRSGPVLNEANGTGPDRDGRCRLCFNRCRMACFHCLFLGNSAWPVKKFSAIDWNGAVRRLRFSRSRRHAVCVPKMGLRHKGPGTACCRSASCDRMSRESHQLRQLGTETGG